MAQNIASIIAINNLLYDQNYDNINDNNDNNNTYLSLLNKFRKFLAIVCLNCKCDQNVNNNSDNQLCDKFNELENQYKNLFNHKIIEHQNKRSNHEVIDDSNHIHCKRVKRKSTEDSDEHDSDDTTHDALNDNTDSNNNVSQLSTLACDVSARKVFNDHIIDVQTKEKVTNNAYVTKLLSTKSQFLNQVIGFRCKYPDCELIVHDISAAYEHVYTDHNIIRPFKCCNCGYYCKTTKSLRNHKNNNCQKVMAAKETLLEDTQYIARIQSSCWANTGFVCKWPKCKFFAQSKSTVYDHLKEHLKIIEHQNKRSNDEVIDDSNHIHSKRVKRQSIERNEVIVIEDSDEHSDDTTQDAPHIDARIINTDSDNVSQLSTLACDVSARKVFNGHIIDVETEEKVMNNVYVTTLLSMKSQSLNQMIGFRCKYPDCEFIARDINAAYEHVSTDHNIIRPFKCCNCGYYLKTIALLRRHKIYCKKELKSKETLMEDNQYFERVEGSDWKSARFVCKWPKCKFFSTSKSTVFEHLKTHNSYCITCFLCDERFWSETQYLLHSKTHKNISIFRRISDTSDTEISQNNEEEVEFIDIRPQNNEKEIECIDISDTNSDNELNPKKYILFCNHIIDTDTYYETEKNKKITRIRSKKPELNNDIIGYRCTRDGCQYMSKSRNMVLSHYEASHLKSKRKAKKNKN